MISIEAIEKFLELYRGYKLFIRGERIFEEGMAKILELDEENGYAQVSVESQSHSNTKYKVELFDLYDSSEIHTYCTCPHETEVCKHGFAALMQLIYEYEEFEAVRDKKIRDSLTSISPIARRDPSTPSIPSSPLEKTLRVPNPCPITWVQDSANLPAHIRYRWNIELTDIINLTLEDHTASSSLVANGQVYHTQVTFIEPDTLRIQCNCAPRPQPLCLHAFTLLTLLASEFECPQDALFPIRNHRTTIASLLHEYGYTLDDDWEKHFDVDLVFPRPNLIPKDPGLSKTAAYARWPQAIERFISPKLKIDENAFKGNQLSRKYAILWSTQYGPLQIPGIYLLMGKKKKNGEIGAPIRLLEPGLNVYGPHPVEREIMLERLEKVNQEKYLKQYGLIFATEIETETYFACVKDIYQHIHHLYPSLLTEDHFLQPANDQSLSPRNLKQIYPQVISPTLAFEFRKSSKHYLLKCLVHVEGNSYPLDKLEYLCYGMFLLEDRLYLFNPQDAWTTQFFRAHPTYRIRHEDLAAFQQQFLAPLAERYEVVSVGEHFARTATEANHTQKLYLKEVEDFLLFIPAFVYTSSEGISREVYLDGGKRLIFQDAETQKNVEITRAVEAEQGAWDLLKHLHPAFSYTETHYFSLPIDKVMDNNWFFSAFEQIQAAGFEILGLKGLQKLKYNPYRPVVQMRASSGTDWFDLQTEVAFGEQQVKLADIRKAIMKRQNYVKLGDGTLGMLPEDWLKKYSTLFKMGKVSGKNVKLYAHQVGLLDGWVEEVEDHAVLEDLLEKRNRLKNFKAIKTCPLPQGLNATLRNYQQEGYNWLHFLNEVGWGGCLADDMGLGKTLQMLAFLLNISQENPNATHLIVVPRSLVFNWIREVEKFCPQFRVLNHTGIDRNKSSEGFTQYDLIVTTYGLVRSDLAWIKHFPFDYVVLDESQAIKNPQTQAAKAVKQLTCRNRLIMTGTPIENNTFDLYSQMDFLNPGMLGSLETFRQEFATPIDKDRDEQAASQLRKLIYPFILSRKKAEVAKELPAKTEIILYCEMPKAQRKVYDYFKNQYKELILEKIESEGMAKAGVYILQGLSKLRQICNSPQLLSEHEGEFTQESAKLEVLMEHLEDIFLEGHKVLIFSFFTGMLDLIGKALSSRAIDYVMLTGKSQKRETLVEEFKENAHKKAFLISLKAGGFGLNLTEASYVFLIDPWWNPAVEQQAIDRTHRIGQDQQVFAYKLICTDTLEEKILQIQEKKLAVSQDLIHTESGFIKKLDPKDIEGLFN